jgi:hypothetical protein
MDGSAVKMVLPQEARVLLVERVFSCAEENTDVCRNAPRISRDASKSGERKTDWQVLRNWISCRCPETRQTTSVNTGQITGRS